MKPTSAAKSLGSLAGIPQGKKILTGIAVEVRETKGIGRCPIALLEDRSAASFASLRH